MDIKSMASKFRMIGKEIKGCNDFGICYEDREDLVLLKQTRGKVKEIKGFDHYMFGKHFIILQSEPMQGRIGDKQLYIKDRVKDQLSGIDVYSIKFPNNGIFTSERVSKEQLEKTEIVVAQTQTGQLFIVNYAGKRMDISKYRDHDPFKTLIIDYNADTNKYSIGYMAAFYETEGQRKREIILNTSYFIKSIDRDLNIA